MPVLKKCTLSDAPQLLQLARRTFVEAFEKDNDPEDFRAYINEAFAKNNIEKQLHDSDSTFYLVYRKEVLVGYFKLNQNGSQTDIKSEDSIELERIYVLKDFQGNQIGEQMLWKAQKIGCKKVKNFLWLGVWQKNKGAIRFYEKHGFVKFGTHPYYIGNDKQTDWLMRFDLVNFRQD